MPYVDSYIWKIRQKIGHDVLIMPSADVVAVDEDDKVLLVYNRDFDNWLFPGGYVELGQNSQECAARELLEEGGLVADPDKLVPFAFVSGHSAEYSSGDVTCPFTQYFVTHEWRDAQSELDAVEVSERKWFSLDEIEKLGVNTHMREAIAAYIKYKQTGIYQMVAVDEGRRYRP